MDIVLALGFLPGLLLGGALGLILGIVGAPAVLMITARSEWKRASSGARVGTTRIGYAPAAPPGDRVAS